MTNITQERAALLEKCADLAHTSNIPDALEAEIRKQGFAGSADIPKLVYLALFTGMLQRPVSLLIKGPSGAGKSFSLRMGKQFIPESAYVEYEGMTEKALVYLEGLNLKHRHLVIGEAAGLADGEGRSLLRQLLSEDIVRYVTVQSTSQGNKGTELPPLEGPCGLIMTTTATGIHPEDESRMISVNIQDSPEQIAEALISQALGSSKKEEPLNTEPWFALYDYVNSGPSEVVVPYALAMAKKLPKTHDRIKRDFPQILSLISASALMHQCRRDLDDQSRVIANVDDYALVRSLVNEPISQGIAVAVPEGIRSVVDATEELLKVRTAENNLGVSQTQVAVHLDRDQSVVSRNVQKAIDEGYLHNNNPGQGREARLELGERELPSGAVLPEPDELLAEAAPKPKPWFIPF